jgi:hypothetical protein
LRERRRAVADRGRARDDLELRVERREGIRKNAGVAHIEERRGGDQEDLAQLREVAALE